MGDSIPESITGKVAAIADEYTLVLNIGRENGVAKGMHFQIIEESVEIKDPDMDEVLGKLEFPKAEVEVISVQDKLCVAQSTAIETRIEEAPLFRLPSMFTPRRIKERKPLLLSKEVEDKVIGVKCAINIGDKAKQI